MKLHFVDQMDEVLKIALEEPLKALVETVPESLIPAVPAATGKAARQ